MRSRRERGQLNGENLTPKTGKIEYRVYLSSVSSFYSIPGAIKKRCYRPVTNWVATSLQQRFLGSKKDVAVKGWGYRSAPCPFSSLLAAQSGGAKKRCCSRVGVRVKGPTRPYSNAFCCLEGGPRGERFLSRAARGKNAIFPISGCNNAFWTTNPTPKLQKALLQPYKPHPAPSPVKNGLKSVAVGVRSGKARAEVGSQERPTVVILNRRKRRNHDFARPADRSIRVLRTRNGASRRKCDLSIASR